MAITTESGLLAGLATGQHLSYTKSGTQATKTTGSWHSLWMYPGIPCAGAAPGSVNGAVPTSATAGALPFANPAGGSTSYLARFGFGVNSQVLFGIYDRLWHNSGLSATAVTLQSITHPGLTRSTTGDGVRLWVEIYTATTAAATATVIYTNQAGTGSRTTTVAIPASTVPTQMMPVSLVAGDTGVRSVQSVQLSGSMTAGNWGLTQGKDLMVAVQPVNLGAAFNPYDIGMPTVDDNACLSLWLNASVSATVGLMGEIILAQG